MNLNNDVYFVQYGDISQKYETLEAAIVASRAIARHNLGECINILKLVGYTQSPAPAIQTIIFKDAAIDGAQVANNGEKVACNTIM